MSSPEYDYAELFRSRFITKYRAGRAEHGTILTSRECLSQAEDEVLDLWAYLQAMKDQKDEVLKLIARAYWASGNPMLVDKCLGEAIHILKYGNKEGRPEGLPVEVDGE